MKKLSLFLFGFLISAMTFALDHSGTISANEAWFASDNPHIITNNLTIADGVTLLIQPGCEIKVQGNRRVNVKGTLSANGTSENPIVFTSNEATPVAGDWRFIYFNGADAGCILNYVELSYGGSSNGMVLVRNSTDNIMISNCTFSNSGGYGLRLTSNADNPSISNCTFENNANYPIYTYADRVKDITGTNTFTGNTPDAIYVRNQTITTGTWLDQGVPYVINGNCTVADLETLTINPGVEINWNGTNRLTVSGALIANGTMVDHISFSSNQVVPAKGDWDRIYFNGAESSSLMYCDFEYAGSGTSTIDVRNSGTNVSIDNCSIDNSGGYGIYNRNGSLSYISDVTIDNCDNYPIYVLADGVDNITGSLSLSGNAPQAIWIQTGTINGGTWVQQSVPYVLGGGNFTVADATTLIINPGVTMKFDGSRLFTVLGTLIADGDSGNPITFTSNSATPNNGDWNRLYFNGADAGCVLDYCQVMYGGSSTNGIMDIRNSGTNVSLSNTTVSNSGTRGVYIRNGSNPSFLNCEIINNTDIGVYINGASEATFGTSELEWNDIYGNGNYELRNGSLDIDAMYIYWGTDACGDISGLIYDDEDQGNLGVVNYDPYLDSGHGMPLLATTWTGAVNTSWHEDGNWDNNAPCGGSDVTIPSGPANQPTVFGPESCNNITLEAGAKLTVGTSNSLMVNGDLLLEADASGTASLVENAGLTVMGNATSEFYITEERWHYVSSPMTGQTANVFYGLYLEDHDELTNDFDEVVDETTPLNVGQGYKVWSESGETGNVTAQFTGGALNSGTYILPVTNLGSGWNFVGNPYSSAIDWDNLSWIKTYIDGTVYVYDGTQYLTWNGSTGDLTDGIIPAMQSFFVKANGTNPVLAVSNGARTHGVDPYKAETVDELLELTITGNGYYDKTFVNFNNEASAGFDNQFDAFKLMGLDKAPQLYTLVGNEKIRMNTMKEITSELSIPMALEVSAGTEYTILASQLNSFGSDVTIYLEDLKENVMINMSQQNDYTFMAAPGDDAHRFNISFEKSSAVVEDIPVAGINIYSNSNFVYVKNIEADLNNASIRVYNISGQKVYEDQLQDIPLNRFGLNLESGYYVVKVVTTAEVSSQKVFIK